MRPQCPTCSDTGRYYKAGRGGPIVCTDPHHRWDLAQAASDAQAACAPPDARCGLCEDCVSGKDREPNTLCEKCGTRRVYTTSHGLFCNCRSVSDNPKDQT